MMQNKTFSTQSPDTTTEKPILNGALFVLVGPAGVGKNAIMKRVMEKLSLHQLPTMTTRTIRTGEQEGREHFFVSLERFQEMIADNALIEHQEVYPGKFYGTPRKPMQDALLGGTNLVADIEVKGAQALKQAFPDNVTLIFIAPPSLKDLEQRLRNRGQMSDEEIQTRLTRAPFELSFADHCDYRVTNDELERSITLVAEIIRNKLAE
jgi:guanylate kinase